jgi:arsenate reductase
MLSRRIEIFAALPIDKLDSISTRAKLREIGRLEGATAKAAAKVIVKTEAEA